MTPLDKDAILDCAALAPSIHNSQPWRITVSDAAVDIAVDPSRLLPWLDEDGRLARISCGAAAEFARLAVRGEGRAATVDIDGGHDDRVARVGIGERLPTSPEEAYLLGAMAIRYTDRGPYRDEPVPPDLVTHVAGLAADHGTWLTVIDGHDQRRIVAQALNDAEAVEAADPRYRAEVDSWLRSSPADDGIPATALPNWPDDRVSDVPLRDFSGAASRPDPAADRPPRVERDLVVAILTPADGPADWAAAGRTLAVLTLSAASMGVTSQPLGPATDFSAARQRLRHSLGWVGSPQVLLRLGYGQGRPATHRHQPSVTAG